MDSRPNTTPHSPNHASFDGSASGGVTHTLDAQRGATARVIGLVKGREIDATAHVMLDGNALVLSWESAAAWRLDLSALDGIMPRTGHLTLYLLNSDVLELAGDDALRTLGTQLLERACTMPELTRGLRALGSQRGAPGAAHDKWFAPLLAARRAVAGITDAERQVALVDAALIAQSMQRTLTELARETAPDTPAMQRAIEAALLEESDSAFTALERLALAADVLRVSALDTRLVDWRRWLSALREVFVAADSSWPRCAAVLANGV